MESAKFTPKKLLKILLVILPLVAIPIAVILVDQIALSVSNIPECPTYSLGVYCPGCGNTRSVLALLRGNILASLRFNPAIIFFVLLGAAFYIELAASVFGKRVRIVPRNSVFLFSVVGLFLAYYIARNFIPILAI